MPIDPVARETCPGCGRRPPVLDCPLCKKKVADATPIHDPEDRPKDGPWIEECGVIASVPGAPLETSGWHRAFGCSCGLSVIYHKSMIWVYRAP